MPTLAIQRDSRSASGARRQETVQRVMDRASRIVARRRDWDVVTGEPTHVLTVRDSGAYFSTGRRGGDWHEMNYDGVVPGTAARQFAEVFPSWLDEASAADHQRRWAPAQALLRAVEQLVHDLELATEHNETLKTQLKEARIEVEFLRRQLDQLTEGLKTNRRSVAKAMLAGVGMILLAVMTGGAEAVAGRALAGESEPTASEFLERCDALIEQFDALDTPGDSWPPADRAPAATSAPS